MREKDSLPLDVRRSKSPLLKRHNFINILPLVLFLLILVSS